MTNKTMLGSLVLAASLLSGTSLAASTHMEPTPDKELPPVENKEAEVIEASIDLALRDVEISEEEESKEDFLPELPILVDGKQYSASELSERGVVIQHYVLDGRSAELKVVQGFRSTESFKQYLERTGQMPEDKNSRNSFFCNRPGQFYEHDFYGGSRFSVYPGQGMTSLGGYWNDRISSLWASPCSAWTILFEHDNFGGHPLWIGRGWAVFTLSNKGWMSWRGWRPVWNSWDNRASSVITSYF